MNLTFSRKLSCFLTCAHRESESAGDRTMVLTSPVPRPADSSASSLLMVAQAAANASLLSYVFPTPSELSKFPADARVHWVPYTKGCELANDCYCFHVAGDMSHKHNPEDWKRCAKKFDIEMCQDDHSCSCLRGEILKGRIHMMRECISHGDQECGATCPPQHHSLSPSLVYICPSMYALPRRRVPLLGHASGEDPLGDRCGARRRYSTSCRVYRQRVPPMS